MSELDICLIGLAYVTNKFQREITYVISGGLSIYLLFEIAKVLNFALDYNSTPLVYCTLKQIYFCIWCFSFSAASAALARSLKTSYSPPPRKSATVSLRQQRQHREGSERSASSRHRAAANGSAMLPHIPISTDLVRGIGSSTTEVSWG